MASGQLRSAISRKSDHKSVVATGHEQNIISSKTDLDIIMHDQTIICKQFFVGHMVGSQPMKMGKKSIE